MEFADAAEDFASTRLKPSINPTKWAKSSRSCAWLKPATKSAGLCSDCD